MKTQEIASPDWPAFFERFSELHRGGWITVEQRERSGETTEVVRDLALLGAEFQKTDGCNDVVKLVLDCPDRREMDHEIIDPIHVKLRHEDGETKVMEVNAESGTSFITFHSGKIDQLLQGLKLV